MQFYVIHDRAGTATRQDFATEGQLIAGLAALGVSIAGLQGSPASHAALLGLPRFDNATGPNWDSGAVWYAVLARPPV